MIVRKKPVQVEAVQLKWENWSEICTFAGVGKIIDRKPQGCYVDGNGVCHDGDGPGRTIGLQIPTLEGVMLARENDWIIQGVNGEFYPCKPDIFEKTYEIVSR